MFTALVVSRLHLLYSRVCTLGSTETRKFYGVGKREHKRIEYCVRERGICALAISAAVMVACAPIVMGSQPGCYTGEALNYSLGV